MNVGGLVCRLSDVFAKARRWAGCAAAAFLLTALVSLALPTNAGAQTLSVTPATVAEDAGATVVTVTIDLGAAAGSDQQWDVSVGLNDDTATEGADYETVDDLPNDDDKDFALTILQNEQVGSYTFNFVPIEDTVDEGVSETLTVKAELGGTTIEATLTITDDDEPPTGITLSVTPASVVEGAGSTEVTVTATVNGGTTFGTAQDVTVKVGASGDTAVEGTDYAAVADFTLEIPVGYETADDKFSLDPTQDGVDEGTGETLSVSGTLSGVTVTGTELTIVDDAEAAAETRLNRVNEEVLPRMAQAMAASTLSAVTGRIDAAVSSAAPAGLNLAGRSSLYHALKSNQRALEDGTLSLTQVLGGSSFALPLNAAENGGTGGLGGLAVWGSGDYRKLSGAEDSTVDWDGDIFSVHLGADMRVRPDLLAGLALSRSRGSFDYTDRTDAIVVGGSYESRMTSVHPYVNWASPEGLGLWATVGYGQGEIEILDDVGGRESSDTNMKTAAVGASGTLVSDDDVLAGGTTALRLKGEGSLARVEVEGNGGINPLTSDVRRLRLSLEGSHERQLASGGRLTPSLELGLRHDGGDAMTGAGVEVGGRLRYVDPASGLTLEGRGRMLVAHEDDHEDWGIGGLVRLDPGADGRGLSLSLVPVWGDAASGGRKLWDRGMIGAPANDNAPAGRLEAELGYGLSALVDRSVVTPFAGLLLAAEGSRRYRVGGRLELAPLLNLSVEGERRESATATADHGVMLRGQLRW